MKKNLIPIRDLLIRPVFFLGNILIKRLTSDIFTKYLFYELCIRTDIKTDIVFERVCVQVRLAPTF